MLNRDLKHARGFSLIEAMMVVAIVGLLASIGIPNFVRMQNRSAQKEAQAMLSEYYRLSKIMTAEYGANPGNFTALGFNPEGEQSYALVTVDNSSVVPAGYPSNVTCINMTNPAGCTPWMAGSDITPKWTLNGSACNPTTISAKFTPTISATSPDFQVFVCSNLAGPDVWSIDQSKNVQNQLSGI